MLSEPLFSDTDSDFALEDILPSLAAFDGGGGGGELLELFDEI